MIQCPEILTIRNDSFNPEMVFDNTPILHATIFQNTLDDPSSIFVNIEVLSVNVPKQMLIQTT